MKREEEGGGMSATTLEELSDSVCAGEKWTLRLELLGWLEKLGGLMWIRLEMKLRSKR